MAGTKTADFLVEIGTEELPPKALHKLMVSFVDELHRLLTDYRLDHGRVNGYASPRRIAAIVEGLVSAQQDREVDAKGPPIRFAFKDNGTPTPAALAFAGKCGVEVSELARTKTDKGEWLSYRSLETGATTETLLPAIVETALQRLPIPRRMRWGESDMEFVRPVHWVVMLHGKAIVAGTVMGCAAGNLTRGHRFLSRGDITIDEPAEYLSLLEHKGFVLADFEARRRKILADVTAEAASVGGLVVADDDLYEEVAALTEWPVAMTGGFDKAFLALPPEVVTASLTSHQRYFPVADDTGRLMPFFVVVANLESTQPDKIIAGNERVIHPRLADAAFFWDNDRKSTLAARSPALGKVVYQKGLGSMLDKSVRVAALCGALASDLGIAASDATRAAEISKCDLLTGMVGEFPELQGVMGQYYAAADGESEAVAKAIGEQYRPRFAGDGLPQSAAGQVLALADKLDTLAGIFALGKKPTGNKDPFGLRRAALGVVRILIACSLELGLRKAIRAAVDLQPVEGIDGNAIAADAHRFVSDRLRSYYVDRADISTEVFDAVASAGAIDDTPLPDFDRRIEAVRSFADMAGAESLASANKRISNMLQQASLDRSDDESPGSVDESLLLEDAERGLFKALRDAMIVVRPLQGARNYAAVLARLAELKDPVDRFFDEVMVMADDEKLKRNRLALLSQLRAPFHSVADISRLSTNKSESG